MTITAGTYLIRRVGTNFYLDLRGGNLAPGTDIILWERLGNVNQKWSVAELPDGTYTLTTESIANAFVGSFQVGAKVTGEPNNQTKLTIKDVNPGEYSISAGGLLWNANAPIGNPVTLRAASESAQSLWVFETA